MKKLMLILVVATVAAPAMADITFTAPPGPTLQIYYQSDDGEDVVRGIALDVTIDSGGLTSNSVVSYVAPDYNCYIDYAWDLEKEGGAGGYEVGAGDGPLANADVAGSLAAPAGEFAISMGVLDEGGEQKGAEPGMTPELLLDAAISPAPGVYIVIIKGDTTRGPDSGVVGSVIPSNLSGGAEITTTITVVPPPTCVKESATFYNEWLGASGTLLPTKLWDKPDCWCYERNCRGDCDGIKVGMFWVQTADLTIFASAFAKPDGQLDQTKICADLDRTKVGMFRVQTADLTIFATYFAKPALQVPACPADDYNFWIVP